MTIKEMHIEVQQATQNISAQVNRKIHPDEMDWLLNKNIGRFVESKVKPRADGSGAFEIDQVNADALKGLVTTWMAKPMRTGPLSWVVEFPNDYLYLISDVSKVYHLCGTAEENEDITENILKIPFPKTTATSGFYASVVVNVSGAKAASLADISSANGGTYTGMKSKDDRDTLIWILIDALAQTNNTAYWERYKNIYAPYTFILPNRTTGDIVIDGTTVAGIPTTHLSQRPKDPQLPWKFRANRLAPSHQRAQMQDHPFMKSSYLSPISEMIGRVLMIYRDISFTVTDVELVYVRKPRQVNLALGIGSDLHPAFHHAICDLTAEYFKAMTTDPSWETKLRDNVGRERSLQQ